VCNAGEYADKQLQVEKGEGGEDVDVGWEKGRGWEIDLRVIASS
jgi:hypothetical protein